MISKKLAIEVLNVALSTGADYAEIFYEDSHSSGLSIENGKVEVASSNSMCGVAIRLLKDNQCIYGYTNNLSKKGLLDLANSLNKSFHGERLITVEKLDMIRVKNKNPITRSYDDVSLEERIALLREGIDEIYSMKDPRIIRTVASFGANHRFVAVFNSKGKWFKRDTEFGRLAYMVIVADQNGFETGFEGPGTQGSIEYFRNVVTPRQAARKAAETALLMFKPGERVTYKTPGGSIPFPNT